MIDKYEFADSLGGVRDFFVDEAMKGSEEMKNAVVTKITVAAACVTLAVAAGLMAFFLGRGGIVTPANTDGQTEPQTSDTAHVSETEPDVTEPVGTTPPMVKTEAEAVEIAYQKIAEVWPYGMTCPYTCELRGSGFESAYVVTIGAPYTRQYRVSVYTRRVSVDVEYDEAEPVPETKVSPEMFESRESVIAADIKFAYSPDEPFISDEIIFNNTDYITDQIMPAYSECHYPGDRLVSIDGKFSAAFDVYRRSREVRGDDGLNKLVLVYVRARYESGISRTFEVYYVVDGPLCRLTGIEESFIGAERYFERSMLDHVRAYVAEDERFAGRMRNVDVNSAPEAGNMFDFIVSEEELIEASGVRGLIGGDMLRFYFLRVEDFAPGSAPDTFDVLISAEDTSDMMTAGSESGKKYYSFVYDTSTGRAVGEPKVSAPDSPGTWDGDHEGIEYDCERFTLYYDEGEDLRIRYKDTGRDALVFHNVDTDESYELSGSISGVAYNGPVTVWRDKKVIFGLCFYEGRGGFVIYDVDTGETVTSDDDEFRSLHSFDFYKVIGSSAVFVDAPDYDPASRDESDGGAWDCFLTFYDLESGEIRTFGALSDALLQEERNCGKSLTPCAYFISGSGRFFAVSLREDYTDDHIVIFDTVTEKCRSFTIESPYSYSLSHLTEDGRVILSVRLWGHDHFAALSI